MSNIRNDILMNLANKNVFLVSSSNIGTPDTKTNIVNWSVSFAIVVDAVMAARVSGETWSLSAQQISTKLKIGDTNRTQVFLNHLVTEGLLESRRALAKHGPGNAILYTPVMGSIQFPKPKFIRLGTNPGPFSWSIYSKIMMSPNMDMEYLPTEIPDRSRQGVGYTLIGYNHAAFISDQDANIIAVHSIDINDPRLKLTWLAMNGVKRMPNKELLNAQGKDFWRMATDRYFAVNSLRTPVRVPTPLWNKLDVRFFKPENMRYRRTAYENMINLTTTKASTFGTPRNLNEIKFPAIWMYTALSDFEQSKGRSYTAPKRGVKAEKEDAVETPEVTEVTPVAEVPEVVETPEIVETHVAEAPEVVETSTPVVEEPAVKITEAIKESLLTKVKPATTYVPLTTRGTETHKKNTQSPQRYPNDPLKNVEAIVNSNMTEDMKRQCIINMMDARSLRLVLRIVQSEKEREKD